MSLKKLLIIDDDKDMTDTFSEVFRLLRPGIKTKVVRSPAEALELFLKGFRPNAVLCDLKFSGAMSGLDFVKQLHDHPELIGRTSAPVVVFTGAADSFLAGLPKDVPTLAKGAVGPDEVLATLEAVQEESSTSLGEHRKLENGV